MEAAIQRGVGDSGVVAGRGADVYEVELVADPVQERVAIGENLNPAQVLARLGPPRRANVRNSNDFNIAPAAKAIQVCGNVAFAGDEPVTHHGASEGLEGASGWH